jgi:hypothetical protein
MLQLHTHLWNTEELWYEINLPHDVHIHKKPVEIYLEIPFDAATYARVLIKETPAW